MLEHQQTVPKQKFDGLEDKTEDREDNIELDFGGAQGNAVPEHDGDSYVFKGSVSDARAESRVSKASAAAAA